MQSTAIIYVTKLDFIYRHNTARNNRNWTCRKVEQNREKAQTKIESKKNKKKTKNWWKQETLSQRAYTFHIRQRIVVTVNRLADKTIHHMRCSIKSLNKRIDSEFFGQITLRAPKNIPFRYLELCTYIFIVEENCQNDFSSWGFALKIFRFAFLMYSRLA